jgi:hypothetical protein
MACEVLGIRRQVVDDNLRHAFPQTRLWAFCSRIGPRCSSPLISAISS